MNTTIRTSPRKKLLQALLLVIGICFINSAWAFKASFTYSIGSGGAVNFTSTSTGTTSTTIYYWTPGDGTALSIGTGMTTYSHTYAYNGTYNVSLFIYDTLKHLYDSTTTSLSITNSGVCNVNASFNYTSGANGLINFTSYSTDTTSSSIYAWNFGDGNNSTSYVSTAPYTYISDGVYYVTLTVTNGYGCSSTVGDSVVITNATPPSNDSVPTVYCTLRASFTTTVGNNGSVTFNSTSTGLTPGMVYDWIPGDNYSGNVVSDTTNYVTYTYPYNGTYIARIWITNYGGSCVSEAYDTVVITNALNIPCSQASFSYTTGANGQVFFTSTSTNATASTQYSWSTDNDNQHGNASTFMHTYAFNGTYSVNLYVSTDSNNYCNSDTLLYITVTNAAPCNIKAIITASIGANGEVTFVNASTGMTPSSYAYWYFGNGSMESGSATIVNNFTYAHNGTYAVNLRVTADTSGHCSSDTTIYVTITNATDSIPACSLNPLFTDSLLGNGGANFTSTSTGVTPNTVYTWNAGDGTPSVSGTGVTSFVHTYAYNGTYYTTLSLYDSTLGCANSASTLTTITTDTTYTPFDTCLYANFVDTAYTHIDSNGIAGNDSIWVSFYSTSDTLCYDSNHAALAHGLSHIPIVYNWNYGDGSSASNTGLTSFQHTYTKNGAYTITLTINHEGSEKKSIYSKIVTVGPDGVTAITKPDADVKLYPNPNNGSFKITLSGIENSQNAELQITNMLGEVIYTTQAHSDNGMIQQDINLPNINSGTYFVRVITNDKVYNTKTVITR